MNYYAHVDGLRAVAVAAVILFHYEVTTFSGGFVGVDVFFVISGFLITKQITSEIEKDEFSFQNFYARRVRRLFPALAVTLMITFLASYFLLSPEHMALFARSVIFSIFPASNILFWQEIGYFDVDSTFKPLLHTWSLSVEEQFYLFWPLFLFLFRSRALGAIIAAGLISFALNIAFKNYPSAMFYLTPFRVFEFCIGAACVWIMRYETPIAAREIGFAIGLLLIAYATLTFSKATHFPSYNALIPCIGSALVIVGHPSRMSRILSNGLMRSIGLISYSLYLVHWPIFVLYKYWKFAPITDVEIMAMIAASLASSIILYRYVEIPFRRGYFVSRKRRPVFYIGTAALAGLMISTPAALAIRQKGWPQRFESTYTAAARAHESTLNKEYPNFCRIEANEIVGECDFNRPRRVLVVGDSHVNAWYQALRATMANDDTQFVMLSYLGCLNSFPKLTNMPKPETPDDVEGHNCAGKAEFIKTKPAFFARFDKIILASYRPFSYPVNQFRWRLIDMFQQAAPRARVFVLGNYFQTSPDKPCNAIMIRRQSTNCLSAEFAEYVGSLDRVQTEPQFHVLKDRGYTFLDIASMACPELKNCPYSAEGVPALRDSDHMTYTFNRYLLASIIKSHGRQLCEIGFYCPAAPSQ